MSMELTSLCFTTFMCATTISVLLQKRAELQSEILTEADKLNTTQFANQSILIYNRVPKVSYKTKDELKYLDTIKCNCTYFQTHIKKPQIYLQTSRC